MTYPEAIQFLYGLRMFGAKLGLENTAKLAQLSGNPQEKLRFIHVAGTNGKGSTCAMLESIYRTAGLRVGLFTSPHLISFRERIQINRQLITEEDVSQLVSGMERALALFPTDGKPTFFEVITVMACQYFAEKGCDLVIWETGMGGRLDATNIVTPLVSVITNIGMDHQKWLGETIEKIAAEKAGIIKPGVPVITATSQPEALEVIQEVARENNSPLTLVTSAATENLPPLSLLGSHQRTNAAVALATTRAIQDKLPVSNAVIQRALSSVAWAGRLQVIDRPSQTVLLDGAHNPDGVAVLSEALRTDFAGRTPTLILGVLADKDWQSMCQALAPLSHRILLPPVSSARTAMPSDMVEICRRANPNAAVIPCESPAHALELSSHDPFVLVTGSLYLIGEVLELLGLSPTNTSERDLNEYGAPPKA